MTDTIEQKALALVNEAHPYTHWNDIRDVGQQPLTKALVRAIEQHEAFRQEVSDAVVAAKAYYEVPMYDLSAFIIAKPVDPLVEALEETSGTNDPVEWANRFYAAIEKRGGKIVWGEG